MMKRKNNNIQKYAAFTGIGIQMGVLIYLGAQLGKYLDAKYEMEKPVFTIGCILVLFGASMYITVKALNRINKNEQ